MYITTSTLCYLKRDELTNSKIGTGQFVVRNRFETGSENIHKPFANYSK
jgi:hypothetical protein